MVAVIVYVAFDAAVGVPLRAPVIVLKVSPAGADGEMEYEATAPPVEIVVNPKIGEPVDVDSLVLERVNAGALTTATGGDKI